MDRLNYDFAIGITTIYINVSESFLYVSLEEDGVVVLSRDGLMTFVGKDLIFLLCALLDNIRGQNNLDFFTDEKKLKQKLKLPKF